MTSPRSDLVDPAATGFYQCMSRRVRCAVLLGDDVSTGRSYEHRKPWAEYQLLELAEGIPIMAVLESGESWVTG